MYEIAWSEFDRREGLANKRKEFKTSQARARFIEKLMEKANYYEVYGTRDPVDKTANGGEEK